MEAKELWGCRKEKLPSSGGGERGLTRTDIDGLRKKGKEIRLRLSPPEGDPCAHSHGPFTTDHRPQTHLLIHQHIPLKAVSWGTRWAHFQKHPFHHRDHRSGPKTQQRLCILPIAVHSASPLHTDRPGLSGDRVGQEEEVTARPRNSRAQPGRRAGSTADAGAQRPAAQPQLHAPGAARVAGVARRGGLPPGRALNPPH